VKASSTAAAAVAAAPTPTGGAALPEGWRKVPSRSKPGACSAVCMHIYILGLFAVEYLCLQGGL
jgi:hypothetical protein